eukprot:CAMPEP_0206436534 /NCGR_PEP_ID=MMETSP0324_2-20121206/10533_1 /ASSEMBLY_ACC=CAM_ASM_000836 /TAXON_ID=2866 /ORGANISM="Crypthecodinium cohnii, Strain Seligo" /LENGTH=550 /DNA_ID=CAMNT_0053903703 /DNA_START=251 /DNA_END=1904 /DNA_ORIENTATION=+
MSQVENSCDQGPCEGLTVPAHAFWMVCLIVFIDSLGGSISAPVLPFYAKEFECDTAQIGFLFSAFSFAQVVFLPVMGRFSDHFGRRAVLVASLFGAALGSFGQGLAPTYWCLFASRIISGACGAVGSTANVYVSDITFEASRGQYLGYLMNSNGAAFAFGPGLGGGLSRLGLNIPIEVNGCACLIAGLLALAYLPESPVFVRHQMEAARQAGRAEQPCHSIPASVWGVCCVEFLRGMSFSAIFTLYGIFANQTFGLDSLHIGYAVCVGALTLICTNVWITKPLESVLGQIGSAALGTTLMAAGEFGLALAPTLWLSLLGMWSVYMGQAVAGCNIAAITSMLATDDNRGEVMSMQQMAQACGRVIGPIILGHLSDMDNRLPFVVAAACVLMATGFLLLLTNAHERRKGDFHSEMDMPLLISPKPKVEEYTDDDVRDLGTFLCNLLNDGGYKWHEEVQREALKKALKCYFPPLGADVSEEAATVVDQLKNARSLGRMPATPNPMRPVTGIGAEVNFTGDDSNFQGPPQQAGALTSRLESCLGGARPPSDDKK